MRRNIRIFRALFVKELVQHYPFLIFYILAATAFALMGNKLFGDYFPWISYFMSPAFLGAIVFGDEKEKGTSLFSASLPVRPGTVWTAKALFGASGILLFVLLITLVNTVFAWETDYITSPGRPHFLIWFLFYIYLSSLSVFAFTLLTVEVIRKSIPSFFIALVGTFVLFAFNLVLLDHHHASPSEAFFPALHSLYGFAVVMFYASFRIFTRGRGHLGFLRDRIGAVIFIAGFLPLVYWIALSGL